MNYPKWTEEEQAELRQIISEDPDISIKNICFRLGRSFCSIQKQLVRQGIKLQWVLTNTPEKVCGTCSQHFCCEVQEAIWYQDGLMGRPMSNLDKFSCIKWEAKEDD